MNPKVVTRRDAESLNVLGVEHVIHVGGDESGGTIVFAELVIPANMGIPRHVHTREDEIFHVLEGEVLFGIGNREIAGAIGTTVFGPRNVPHSYAAANGRSVRMIVTITPSGMEPMFRELSRLPAGAPDLARVAEIVGRYGIAFA